MGTINRRTIILLVALLTLSILIYGIVIYKQYINLKQQHTTELQYAEDFKSESKNKPFLSKLPIFSSQYSIFYNSLNDEINVVFKNNADDLDSLKMSYQDQIYAILQKIGVDTQKMKIIWLKAN